MALLTAQVLGERVVGTETSIPSRSTYQDQPYRPFKVEDTVSNNYADISSISNWHEYGIESNYLRKDYLYIRNEILKLIEKKAEDSCIGALDDPSTVTPSAGARYCVGNNPVGEFFDKQGTIAERSEDNTAWDFLSKDVLGYSLCSSEEKRIAAQLNIGLIKDHKIDFDDNETILWREEYHEKATETRIRRMRSAETLIVQELPDYQTPIMLTITSLVINLNAGFGELPYSIDMHKNYNYFGVIGTIENYHPINNKFPGNGIIDFFYGRSMFSGKGLIDTDWIPVNMTLQQLCDRVYDILVNGNTLSSL